MFGAVLFVTLTPLLCWSMSLGVAMLAHWGFNKDGILARVRI
jgi:hypothetical protein